MKITEKGLPVPEIAATGVAIAVTLGIVGTCIGLAKYIDNRKEKQLSDQNEKFKSQFGVDFLEDYSLHNDDKNLGFRALYMTIGIHQVAGKHSVEEAVRLVAEDKDTEKTIAKTIDCRKMSNGLYEVFFKYVKYETQVVPNPAYFYDKKQPATKTRRIPKTVEGSIIVRDYNKRVSFGGFDFINESKQSRLFNRIMNETLRG